MTVFIKTTYHLYIGKLLHKILNSFNILIPEITEKEKQGEYDSIFAKAYPNALAILLLHQLKKYPETMKRRNDIMKQYADHFKTNAMTTEVSQTRFPLLVEDRDTLIKQAADKDIFLGVWYDQVVAPYGLDLTKVQYEGQCPTAESISKRIINLPLLIDSSKLQTLYNLWK